MTEGAILHWILAIALHFSCWSMVVSTVYFKQETVLGFPPNKRHRITYDGGQYSVLITRRVARPDSSAW